MKAPLLLAGFVLTTFAGFSQNTNCSGATQVCNDISFSGNSAGSGTPDLNGTNQGCLTLGEHQSSWYYFQPVTSGTVALTIQTAFDYDFAIWATGNCNSLGAPVRCSYSSHYGNTGLMTPYNGQTSSTGCGFFWLQPCSGLITTTNNPVDNTEGAGGDGWVNALPVVAGQTYIMLIDNFTANATPFTLDWTFTGGASLNCAPIVLPIEIEQLMANYDATNNSNKVYWKTASERLNDHFTLERSTDAVNWKIINQQAGAENSTEAIHYTYDDYAYEPGQINYYRLSQTDYDGTIEIFDILAVDNSKTERKIVKIFNTMGQEVPPETTGIVILLYEDGTTRRVLRY